MRDKILQALREAKGNCLTPKALMEIVDHDMIVWSTEFASMWQDMEQEKLIILGRSSGGAGVPRGTITLISLRQEEKE